MFLLIELIIWAVICLVFVSYEKGVGAFVATGIAGVVACFVAGFNPFTWLWANPLIFGQLCIAYVGIGLIWSSVKWYAKLRKSRKLYLEAKADWVAKGKTEQSFIETVRGAYGDKERYAPTVSRNKSNLGFWCIWWPFSIIAFMFEDLIRELWNLSWKFLKNMFEGMRRRTLGEAARDLD